MHRKNDYFKSENKFIPRVEGANFCVFKDSSFYVQKSVKFIAFSKFQLNGFLEILKLLGPLRKIKFSSSFSSATFIFFNFRLVAYFQSSTIHFLSFSLLGFDLITRANL